MKRVLISSLRGGEVLAQEVWDQNGVQLLAAGTTYKPSYQKLLKYFNVGHVYIEYDEKVRSTNGPKKVFNAKDLYQRTKILVTEQMKRFEEVGNVNIYKFEKLIDTILDEIMDSVQIIESMYHMQNYNDYTYEHAVNVTVLAIMICNEMKLSKYKTYEIAMGCMLHDLGKTKIPIAILNKPEKLTEEEFDEIKKHPVAGYNFIKDNRNLSNTIKKIILTHHEKLDGSGYPLGITGDNICIGTRICTVADIFDAMSSKRPYKEAMSLPESIRIMKSTMREQIDMSVCNILEEILTASR